MEKVKIAMNGKILPLRYQPQQDAFVIKLIEQLPESYDKDNEFYRQIPYTI